MKAVLHSRYGPPNLLEIVERPTPVPGERDVLVRVLATTVSSGDCNVRNLTFVPPSMKPMARLAFGIGKPWRPAVLGTQLAGTIEAVGARVTRFEPGDAVFGSTGMAGGGHAQYARLPEKAALALRPHNLSFEEAVALPFGADVAITYLRDYGRLQAGHELLVLGASGSIGSAAVQIATHWGARVTGVCSGANVELVRSLGADEVIDYTQADFAQNGQTYDRILDTVGVTTFGRCRNSLKPDGIYLPCVGSLTDLLLRQPWTSMRGDRKLKGGVAVESPANVALIRELAESGVLRPVIDSTYPLERIADAFRRAETGHKRGSVVVTVSHEQA